MIWGWIIPGWVKRAALAALGASLALLGAFYAGKREGAQARKMDALEADRKTDRRIDNADVSSGDSDADREWLRKRSQR